MVPLPRTAGTQTFEEWFATLTRTPQSGRAPVITLPHCGGGARSRSAATGVAVATPALQWNHSPISPWRRRRPLPDVAVPHRSPSPPRRRPAPLPAAAATATAANPAAANPATANPAAANPAANLSELRLPRGSADLEVLAQRLINEWERTQAR